MKNKGYFKMQHNDPSRNDQRSFNRAMNATSTKDRRFYLGKRSRHDIRKGNDIAFYVGLVIFLGIVAFIIYGIRF
jgi:hypothetical protein